MYSSQRAKDDSSNMPAIILAWWLIVGAIFGRYFFVIKLPGLFDISLERILFFILILILTTGLFSGKVGFLKSMTIESAMAGFALVCIISMMKTGFSPSNPDFPSPWFVFITGYLFPFIVFIYAKNFLISEKDLMIILHALFYFGVYLSITAFFEYSNLRQFVFPQYINDPLVSPLHLERARGPFLNAAFNGVGILFGFISGLHLLQKKAGLTKFFYQAGLLLYFPAVFFTLTRSVYLGLLITLFIFLGWYKTSASKWKLISLPLAVVLIIGIANSPRLLSSDRRAGGVYQVDEVAIRVALLQKSYFLFSSHPLTGIGMAQFIPSSTRSYRGPVSYIAEEAGTQFQHNHLLGIATELGLPGIILYLAIVYLILRRLTMLSERLPEQGLMGYNLRILILAVWFVYLNNNLFVEPSNNIFINAVPFLFAGLADGIYARSLQPGLEFKSPVRMMSAHV
ncbi:MAG: O-antigen ligase family protein [Syntrophales bacterium LBB04]|nr:O-antigen ligase family protein [Syntrophales bacterium LBB04]